jgi:hypothetical protein
MKVEKHADGQIALLLTAEDDIDEFFLRLFMERVTKGQTVQAKVDTAGRLVMAVEK